MNSKNPYKAYKKVQIQTANQGKLIVMMYDGIIKNINKALDYLPQKKYEDINNAIIKAQDIIAELMASLNMDVGTISQNLLSIYLYMNQKLLQANIKKIKEPLLEVKKIASELKEVWEKISDTPIKQENQQTGGINIAT